MYSIVNNIVLGHGDDETPLAGLGLGALTIGITALSIGICFAYGAGTFMSQEYGRKNYRGMNVYLNRSLFLNTVVFFILLIPTLFIDQIYEAIGQDPEVAAYGATYVHIIMPFLFLDLINWAFIMFLNSQRIMIVTLLSTASGAILHLACIGLFYFYLDWGYEGICWATAMVFVGRFLAVQTYMRCCAAS